MTLPLSVVAYINGVRFMPSSVGYFNQAGMHPTFTVDIPAVPELDVLPERSHCVLFFADPVGNHWRMLCEGEYVGYTKTKSAVGARRRCLTFRSLHAMWETTQYQSFCGILAKGGVSALMAGQVLPGENPDTSLDLARANIQAFMEAFSASSTRISTFLPAFAEAAMQQSPVDAFYYPSRKAQQKLFAFADTKIGEVLTPKLFEQMIRNEWPGGGPNTAMTLEQIVCHFENLAMYQHIGLPAPPLYKEGVLPETIWLPHLYSVVPPACNVIFKDQITDIQSSRNFLAEPTRVITELMLPGGGGNSAVPAVVMTNGIERTFNFIETLQDERVPPNRLVTHGVISKEEYLRGINPVHVDFPFANLSAAAAAAENGLTEAQISQYLQQASRHYYFVTRGASRQTVVNCVYLPYLVPGLPCLIEDDSGSFWGVIQSVSHSLPSTGQPSTSIIVTHLRETYIVDGTIRNTPNPMWLNTKFLPSEINSTYAKLFGTNETEIASPISGTRSAFAAMVPADVITSVGVITKEDKVDAQQQVNLDELASYVVHVPRYTKDGRLISADSLTVPMAEHLRNAADPTKAMLRYQYRPGVTISQYAAFHNLAEVDESADGVFEDTLPPQYLAEVTGEGHPLFGAPHKLVFTGNKTNQNNPYGIYQTEKVNGQEIDNYRQRVADLIGKAIARRITEG